MPNVIDQRLAARFHLWQIASVGRADRLANRVGRTLAAVAREAAAIAAEDRPPHETRLAVERAVAAAQARAYAETREGLVSLADAGHREAVAVLMRTVPLAWFAKLHPRLAWLAQSPPRRTAEADGEVFTNPLDYEYDFEPVVPWRTNPRVAREEAMTLIRSLLFPSPSPERVGQWLAYSIGGMTWDHRFRRYEEQDRAFILGQLTDGIAAGENVRQLRQRMLPVVDGTIYRAQRIARTEGRRVGELAQQEALGSLGDLISGQQIVAVMDQWTRSHHAARNGKVYQRQANGSFVADDGELLPQLPDEPNCRCMAVPILAPPTEVLDNPALAAQFRTSTGDQVPDPAAYTEWFRRADTEKRQAAVGVARYRSVATAEYEPDWLDFIDADGRLVPVAQLRRESAGDRQARRDAVRRVLSEREGLFRQVYRQGFLAN